MNIHNKRILLIAIVALCTGTGACVASSDEGADLRDPSEFGMSEADVTFFEQLRLTTFDYPVARNAAAQADRSEVVVRAKFSDVVDGRTFIAPRGDASAIHTAILEFEVMGKVKGAPSDRVHVEYIVGQGLSTEELASLLPSHPVTLYLNDVTELEQVWEVHDDGRGRPGGSRLYEMVTPQGLVMSTPSGKDVQPLAGVNVFPGIDPIAEPESHRVRMQRGPRASDAEHEDNTQSGGSTPPGPGAR